MTTKCSIYGSLIVNWTDRDAVFYHWISRTRLFAVAFCPLAWRCSIDRAAFTVAYCFGPFRVAYTNVEAR